MKRLIPISIGAILAAVVIIGLLLPVPQVDAATGSRVDRVKTSGTDSLAVATIDTSSTFSIKGLKNIVVAIEYDGDSAKAYVDYSFDNTHWTNIVGATQLNGAPGTTAVQLSRVLTQTASGGAAYLPSFIGYQLRVRVNNDDSASKLTNLRYWVMYE